MSLTIDLDATPNSNSTHPSNFPTPESRIFVFGIPIPEFGNGGLEFALHRRGNRWFVVHPRAYGMAESRWVASLNNPRDTDPPSTAPPASFKPHLNHRFWYNSERLALDHLLIAEPMFNYNDSVQPILKVTGMSRAEKRRVPGSEVDVQIEAKQVEVLIKEDQLCKRCIYCGDWEESGRTRRHVKISQDGEDPLYWCGTCNVSPVKRLWNKMPSSSFGKKDGNDIDWAYF